MSVGENAEALHEARDLGYKVVEVSKRMSQDFDTIAQSHGLTPMQARILLELADPKPMRDIAMTMTCDASNITGFADRLERLGLVERIPGSDRRVKLLSLTQEGEELRHRLANQIGAEALLMAKLTKDERAQFEVFLDKILV